MTFRAELATAAERSHVRLEESTIAACEAHFELLVKWNQTHNLTRIVDPAEAARKHYLDCLVPLLGARDRGVSPVRFVDVGSGAGFPGLLACLVWPTAEAILVEPAQKRASFLTVAARAMGRAVSVRSTATEVAAMPIDGTESLPGSREPSCHAVVVLSRATFSAGKRGELRTCVAEEGSAAGIAVWGHANDVATWRTEVVTWKTWGPAEQPYVVDGLEPRSLLWATRGEFHVKHPGPTT